MPKACFWFSERLRHTKICARLAGPIIWWCRMLWIWWGWMSPWIGSPALQYLRLQYTAWRCFPDSLGMHEFSHCLHTGNLAEGLLGGYYDIEGWPFCQFSEKPMWPDWVSSELFWQRSGSTSFPITRPGQGRRSKRRMPQGFLGLVEVFMNTVFHVTQYDWYIWCLLELQTVNMTRCDIRRNCTVLTQQ